MRIVSTFLLAFILLTNISCGNNEDTFVRIETQFGNIKIRLYNETPVHRDNFLKLTQEGFYNGLLFHRVIQNFMIQGGDPGSRNAEPEVRLGLGTCGYTLPAEFVPRYFHKRGALAAARFGNAQNPEKRSSGSQFYIVQGRVFSPEEIQAVQQKRNSHKSEDIFQKYCNQEKTELAKLQEEHKDDEFNTRISQLREKAENDARQVPDYVYSKEQIDAYTSVGGYPPLDGEYTVFGEVVEGMDVVDKIAAFTTDENDRPMSDVKFKITICD